MSAARDDPAPDIERTFGRIAAGAMADLPLNNPALRVEAVGFRLWQGLWVGVVITPWAINLLLLPAGSSAFAPLALGKRHTWTFPSGDYPFMGSADADLGPYQFCSLFSPTFEFTTQADARTAAHAAMAALFEATQGATADAEAARLHGRSVADVPLSRRGFLRGDLFGRHE
jgi:[NiFe] hydrogenase assembly HybE family chaperone